MLKLYSIPLWEHGMLHSLIYLLFVVLVVILEELL